MITFLLIITYLGVNIFSYAFSTYEILARIENFNTSKACNKIGDIDPFVKQFDLFNNNKFDKSFFNVRKKRNSEFFSPEIKTLFSS